MRIIIDLQGAQTESRYRGIGRYVTSLAKALIRNGSQHEFFILLNGLFAETIQSIRLQFEDVLPQSQILVWYAPGPVNGYSQASLGRREIAELIRNDFIQALQPDALYISSLFEGSDAVVNVPKESVDYQIGVTFYDLIPLLNPDQYFLGNPQFKDYYFEKIDCLKRADTLFAISEFSRREALEHLELEASLVVNVSTASDDNIMSSNASAHQDINDLLARLKISKPFVLYTGGGDGRKNLPRLAQAFAGLPREFRKKYQLVMAGRMLAVQAKEIEQAAEDAGLDIEEDLVMTGYVIDADLQQLYRHCQLFVFPSWHEGFGLPALEAMQCGAVVVAAGNTSLPEVLNFESALFDPMDVDQMMQKIAYGLEDETFRKTFLEHAKIQSKLFSWDISARRLLDEFESRFLDGKVSKKPWLEIESKRSLAKNKLLDQCSELSIRYGLDTRIDDLALAYALSDNEKILSAALKAGELPTSITWRVEGPFDSSYSLALLNRETARALARLGQNVVLHSTEGPGDYEADPAFLEKNPELSAMRDKVKELTPQACDVSSRNLYPPRVHDMASRINMLHHYAWEESAFPADWVEEFNDNLQGMTCLSNHVRKIMIDNGVAVPMSVSGCGVDHWLRIESDPAYKVSTDYFVFLHVSSCFPRKGVGALLSAYGQAFTSNDPVALIIKTFPNPHNEAGILLEECKATYPNYPEVRLIEEDLSESQLKALYEQSHALVAPSRAEGFGLPMAEAMLSGMPVITTGWGGQLDFCNSETAWLIDYTYQRAVTHFELFDSVWAAPDVQHLAELMKEVYEAPEDVKARKNDKAKALLLSECTWSDVTQKLINAARQSAIVDRSQVVRLGWVTSWNTPCGIASYSAHLMGAMSHEATVFARYDMPEEPDDKNVVRCWHMNPDENLHHLASEIEYRDINVLVVQFNYGFYEFDGFSVFLNRMTAQGLKVIVMLHATIDPPSLPKKRLEILRGSLSQCYRLLVHTPADLNRLKLLGLDHIAAIFPHGVVDRSYRKATKAGRVIKLASYGFFLPSKGLLELIDAIAMLKLRGFNIHLSMINAEYPLEISAQLIAKAKKRIALFGLDKQITLNTAFLPEAESFRLLEQADCIVFPYRESNESSSAAVRYGLATGRPIAVTPVNIFEDVSPAVFTLPGTDAADMAEGLADIIRSMKLQDEPYVAQMKKSHKWLETHRYSQLGQRLSNIIQSSLVNL